MKSAPSMAFLKAESWVSLIKAFVAMLMMCVAFAIPHTTQAQQSQKKPNILVIWGDDIGFTQR